MSSMRNIVLFSTAVVASLAVATSADAAKVKLNGQTYVITGTLPVSPSGEYDTTRIINDNLGYRNLSKKNSMFVFSKNTKWTTVSSRTDATGKRVYQQKTSLKISGKNLVVYRTYTNVPVISKPAKYVSQVGHKYYKMSLGPITTKPQDIKKVAISFTDLDNKAGSPTTLSFLNKSFKIKASTLAKGDFHFWPGEYGETGGVTISNNVNWSKGKTFTLAVDNNFSGGARFIPVNFYTSVKGGWKNVPYIYLKYTDSRTKRWNGTIVKQSDLVQLKDSSAIARNKLNNEVRVYGDYDHVKFTKQIKAKETMLAKVKAMRISDEKTRDAALKALQPASPYAQPYLDFISSTDPRVLNKDNIAAAKKYGATGYLKKVNTLVANWKIDYPRFNKFDKAYWSASDEVWTKYWASKNITVKINSAESSSSKTSSATKSSSSIASSSSTKSSSSIASTSATKSSSSVASTSSTMSSSSIASTGSTMTSSSIGSSQSVEPTSNQTSTSSVDDTTQSDSRN